MIKNVHSCGFLLAKKGPLADFFSEVGFRNDAPEAGLHFGCTSPDIGCPGFIRLSSGGIRVEPIEFGRAVGETNLYLTAKCGETGFLSSSEYLFDR